MLLCAFRREGRKAKAGLQRSFVQPAEYVAPRFLAGQPPRPFHGRRRQSTPTPDSAAEETEPHWSSPSTLALPGACRRPFLTPGGHYPRVGVWSPTTSPDRGAQHNRRDDMRAKGIRLIERKWATFSVRNGRKKPLRDSTITRYTNDNPLLLASNLTRYFTCRPPEQNPQEGKRWRVRVTTSPLMSIKKIGRVILGAIAERNLLPCIDQRGRNFCPDYAV